MRPSKRYRAQFEVELLDGRVLLTTGLSASLSHGVLSVVGASSNVPIEVDVLATQHGRRVGGVVEVVGVGNFRAGRVREVVVSAQPGEPVTVNRGPRWNPAIVVNGGQPTAPQVTITAANVGTMNYAPPLGNPAPAGATLPSATLSAMEQAIVDAVNVARQQNGLAPLTVNTRLVQAAKIQSQNMVTFGTMSHVLPGAAQPTLESRAAYVGYNYSYLGENIAFGYSDAASVMNAWMNSPGHRANILGSQFAEIGVGVAFDANGMAYATQEFGKAM